MPLQIKLGAPGQLILLNNTIAFYSLVQHTHIHKQLPKISFSIFLNIFFFVVAEVTISVLSSCTLFQLSLSYLTILFPELKKLNGRNLFVISSLEIQLKKEKMRKKQISGKMMENERWDTKLVKNCWKCRRNIWNSSQNWSW